MRVVCFVKTDPVKGIREECEHGRFRGAGQAGGGQAVDRGCDSCPISVPVISMYIAPQTAFVCVARNVSSRHAVDLHLTAGWRSCLHDSVLSFCQENAKGGVCTADLGGRAVVIWCLHHRLQYFALQYRRTLLRALLRAKLDYSSGRVTEVGY